MATTSPARKAPTHFLEGLAREAMALAGTGILVFAIRIAGLRLRCRLATIAAILRGTRRRC